MVVHVEAVLFVKEVNAVVVGQVVFAQYELCGHPEVGSRRSHNRFAQFNHPCCMGCTTQHLSTSAAMVRKSKETT